jgi:ferredoxin-type protein NapH
MNILRRIIQSAALVLVNSSFLLGQPLPDGIYQGPWKQICSPGLNCYACPYAVAACPIGSLQYFIAYGVYHFSVYILGFLVLAGTLAGRLVCGWICPFGLFQDLLYLFKTPKVRLFPPLRHLRWPILLGLVLLLPLLTQKSSYCSFICPAGTLQGGIPFAVFSSQVRAMIGPLYFIKVALLALFALGSIFIFRFFCRSACPLGLIYGFFNRIAFLGIRFDSGRCNRCGVCENSCPVNLKPQEGEFNSGECIRCLKCVAACPRNCLRLGIAGGGKILSEADREKQTSL